MRAHLSAEALSDHDKGLRPTKRRIMSAFHAKRGFRCLHRCICCGGNV